MHPRSARARAGCGRRTHGSLRFRNRDANLSLARRRGDAERRETTKEDDVLSSTAQAAFAAAKTGSGNGVPGASTQGAALLSAVRDILDRNKAEEIVTIDLRGKSSVCDWMVICSGRSSRQVTALAETLESDLKADHGVLARTEGKTSGDWVLIDADDVVVHVFRPEMREFYQLEKMWQPAGAAAPAG